MDERLRPSSEEVFRVLNGECSSLDGFDGDYRRWVVENAEPTVLKKLSKEISLGAIGKITGRHELPQELESRLRIEGKI